MRWKEREGGRERQREREREEKRRDRAEMRLKHSGRRQTFGPCTTNRKLTIIYRA